MAGHKEPRLQDIRDNGGKEPIWAVGLEVIHIVGINIAKQPVGPVGCAGADLKPRTGGRKDHPTFGVIVEEVGWH